MLSMSLDTSGKKKRPPLSLSAPERQNMRPPPVPVIFATQGARGKASPFTRSSWMKTHLPQDEDFRGVDGESGSWYPRSYTMSECCCTDKH